MVSEAGFEPTLAASQAAELPHIQFAVGEPDGIRTHINEIKSLALNRSATGPLDDVKCFENDEQNNDNN